MPIELALQYQSAVDELFTTESKRSLLTNQDYNWSGAHSIKVYSVSTAPMTDYGRNGPDTGNWSRYGKVEDLNATTQEMPLRKDRSFTFAVDKLDTDETVRALQAATALARQLREVVVPEVDRYVYAEMCENAGQTPAAVALTPENIYELIVNNNKLLDDQEVPETNRILLVTPDTYLLMKKSPDIILETDITAEMRLRGVIAMLDGLAVIKVPATRLPAEFGFMIAHPVATVAPVKLESYKIHEDPPGISGSLVEGRVAYDCHLLNNKVKAVLYQAKETETEEPETK